MALFFPPSPNGCIDAADEWFPFGLLFCFSLSLSHCVCQLSGVLMFTLATASERSAILLLSNNPAPINAACEVRFCFFCFQRVPRTLVHDARTPGRAS